MKSIDRFISHACPLMFGAHHRIPGSTHWIEEKKLPIRLRCKGFRAVLMILGALVSVSEGEAGYQTFHIAKDSDQEFSKKQLGLTLPKNSAVLTTFLKKK